MVISHPLKCYDTIKSISSIVFSFQNIDVFIKPIFFQFREDFYRRELTARSTCSLLRNERITRQI